jgi:hypothetical protein
MMITLTVCDVTVAYHGMFAFHGQLHSSFHFADEAPP